MLQTGKKATVIHTLSNISGIKGNQTMKFGQLIEHNMRKCDGAIISRPFSKK